MVNQTFDVLLRRYTVFLKMVNKLIYCYLRMAQLTKDCAISQFR